MVPVAPTLGLQCFEHLVHDGRDRQGHSVLPARCKGYTQILVVQFYPETRLEVVREELLLFGLHHRAARQPPGERLHQLLRRDPAPGAQHERLGDSLDGKRDHDLVACFDHLTGSDGSNMRRHLPHYVEQWASTLEVLLRTAHHDGERALYGPHVTSGDRRVQHRGALLSDLLRKLLGDYRRDGAHVHHQRALADAFEGAALPDHHSLNVRRVGEHGDDDVARLSHLPRAPCGGRVSFLCQFLRLLRAAVVQDQLVARLHQVLRHRPAHDPKSYKTYRVTHDAPLLKTQIRYGHVPAAQFLRQPAKALFGRLCGRVVLQADVAIVAEFFEFTEDERVADLPRPRLTAARRIGYLDVTDVVEVLAQVGDQVPFHALHVIEVVLYPHVLPSDTLHKFHGLPRCVKEIRSVLEGVDCLYHDRDFRCFCLLCGEAYILTCQRELLFAVRAEDLLSHEHVYPLTAQGTRQIDGDGHVIPEQMLPLGIAHEPPVPGRQVSGIEVEERHVEPSVLNGVLYHPQLRLVSGPPELDHREACCGSPPKP